MKKFDFCIGNPAYQETQDATSDKPVYNYFMDEAFKIASKVEMITPARFLFNAGKTKKEWNQKMLNDEHFKVIHYENNALNIFHNTEIKGGVAITYRDENKIFGAIGIFTKYDELNHIAIKVRRHKDYVSLTNIIYQQNRFDLCALYSDYPDYKNIIGSNGKEKRLTTPIFDQLPVFKKVTTKEVDEIIIYGLIKNIRYSKVIKKKYIEKSSFVDCFKVVTPASGGSGEFGETLSSPVVLGPGYGFTQSFIGIGQFEEEEVANAALKYIKTKFCRALLGILKVTQHAHKEVWTYVPLQKFTHESDIEWSRSIAEIDRQLYKKYGLSEEEIEFIETHVKEMA